MAYLKSKNIFLLILLLVVFSFGNIAKASNSKLTPKSVLFALLFSSNKIKSTHPNIEEDIREKEKAANQAYKLSQNHSKAILTRRTNRSSKAHGYPSKGYRGNRQSWREDHRHSKLNR